MTFVCFSITKFTNLSGRHICRNFCRQPCHPSIPQTGGSFIPILFNPVVVMTPPLTSRSYAINRNSGIPRCKLAPECAENDVYDGYVMLPPMMMMMILAKTMMMMMILAKTMMMMMMICAPLTLRHFNTMLCLNFTNRKATVDRRRLKK